MVGGHPHAGGGGVHPDPGGCPGRRDPGRPGHRRRRARAVRDRVLGVHRAHRPGRAAV
ncbi:hypothetical protein ACFSTC_21475 [Nonomuraea ferruginea]